LLAWAFHSSVAAILLVASLSEQGIVPSALIIPFVLGINFGGVIIGAALTRGEERAARFWSVRKGCAVNGGAARLPHHHSGH